MHDFSWTATALHGSERTGQTLVMIRPAIYEGACHKKYNKVAPTTQTKSERILRLRLSEYPTFDCTVVRRCGRLQTYSISKGENFAPTVALSMLKSLHHYLRGPGTSGALAHVPQQSEHRRAHGAPLGALAQRRTHRHRLRSRQRPSSHTSLRRAAQMHLEISSVPRTVRVRPALKTHRMYLN
jgi:hypothetical protein